MADARSKNSRWRQEGEEYKKVKIDKDETFEEVEKDDVAMIDTHEAIHDASNSSCMHNSHSLYINITPRCRSNHKGYVAARRARGQM